jgi:hypothetical protein
MEATLVLAGETAAEGKKRVTAAAAADRSRPSAYSTV